MFNVTGGEIIIILLLALIVLGPDKLPDFVRRAGRVYGEVKKMASGFQTEFRDAVDEPMREMRDTANLARTWFEEGRSEADVEDGDDLVAVGSRGEDDDELDDEFDDAEMSADGDIVDGGVSGDDAFVIGVSDDEDDADFAEDADADEDGDDEDDDGDDGDDPNFYDEHGRLIDVAAAMADRADPVERDDE